MHSYHEVTTRFLDNKERLILSLEKEMPLVIEAKANHDIPFLQNFLHHHSQEILADIAHYGAVLLRGFAIKNEKEFEQIVLSIQGFQGISEAFMSEEGRIHVDNLRYVLYTNAVYKTGGTLYLGGFHSENYYSADVPSYISFCCLKPSLHGGETGLINMEKVYENLDDSLRIKLEKEPFFAAKWLISEIASRYKISERNAQNICQDFGFKLFKNKFALMYKPNVFIHPLTQKKSLAINLFELKKLNRELRKLFLQDYPGKSWFFHRLVWHLPEYILKILEWIYVGTTSFTHSPKNALNRLIKNLKTSYAAKKIGLSSQVNMQRVGNCFNDQQIKQLARLLRQNYCSCLWQQGDILLVDNRKIVHAGMPGAGPRLIRAMIGNPITMDYTKNGPGCLFCHERKTDSVGFYMANGEVKYKKYESHVTVK